VCRTSTWKAHSSMDASVSRLVDAYADNVVATTNAETTGSNRTEELDVDALFDQLENEDDGVLREKRLVQLHREYVSQQPT
jgi:hypothetical protein